VIAVIICHIKHRTTMIAFDADSEPIWIRAYPPNNFGGIAGVYHGKATPLSPMCARPFGMSRRCEE
jgi:hypothetical protein